MGSHERTGELIRPGYVIRQRKHSLIVRAIATLIWTVASATIIGCSPHEPVQKSASPTVVETPAPPPPPEVKPSGRSLPPEPQLLEGSGVAVWARPYKGLFIAGLDGALYDPYRPATLQRVQSLLRERGLYAGSMNGILDKPTMKSIYAFQEANNLQRCGVPTPHTRRMLDQGSHTDLSFSAGIHKLSR